jgi:hypothetical protein
MRAVILRQIREITRLFIANSLSVYQKYPEIVGHDICWEGFRNISFVLQNEPYEVIYRECLKEKDFNILMLDGALIQFMYRFRRDEIVAHKIAFYPSPSIERFQDNPDIYEQYYYGQEIFTDIFDEKVVCAPMRFDFDSAEEKHVDVNHPKSHLTLGNYTNCRIPVKAPITPYRFILFILRSFYFDKFTKHFNDATFRCGNNVGETLTHNEKLQIHLNWTY